MKLKKVLADTAIKLSESGIEGAARDARLLAAFALEIPISELSLKINEQVSEKIIAELEKLILRRIDREPISKILGRREFWGRSFSINENVLDPRGDTETLIEFVIEKPVKSVLELGTGSGAIAITLACEWKEVHVTAVDISEEALSLAKINAEKFNVQNKIDLDDCDDIVFDCCVSAKTGEGFGQLKSLIEGCFNGGVKAVSYTHLTLPTKRIV